MGGFKNVIIVKFDRWVAILQADSDVISNGYPVNATPHFFKVLFLGKPHKSRKK